LSETLYAKLAILLPLAAAAVAWLLAYLGIRVEAGVSAVLIGSLLLGGVPYALCAGVALLYLRDRNAESHWRLAAIAPFAFTLVLALDIAFSESLGRMEGLGDLLAALLLSAAFAIPVGYTYLALILLLRRWVVRRPHRDALNADVE
jgi:hypothetical protein